MKVLNWILNHLKIVLAIVVFGVTLGVIGGTMLGSYNDYLAYEKKYAENDLVVRSATEASPKKAEINDNFSSKLKKSVKATRDDVVVTGEAGDEAYVASTASKIELTLQLAEKSLVDLDLELRSAYVDEEENTLEIKDLLSVVNLRVNNSLMEDEINLPAEDWHHLVMSGFALPKGTTTIVLEAINGKTQYMPELMSITFHSNEIATFVA